MTYRDELTAAHTRIRTLERELSTLRRERDVLAAEVRQLRASAPSMAAARAPQRPQALDTPAELNYCNACGGANATHRATCEHCGEPLTADIGASTSRCPACREGTLSSTSLGAIADLTCCARCGGMWLTSAVLPQLLEAAGRRILGFEPHEVNALWSGEYSGSRPSYLRCPECRQTMVRRAHSAAKVVLDVCTAHGLWLDRGELPKLLEAAAKGARDNPLHGNPLSGRDDKGGLFAPSRDDAILDWMGSLLTAKIYTHSIW